MNDSMSVAYIKFLAARAERCIVIALCILVSPRTVLVVGQVAQTSRMEAT